jgi:hypothetical protein
VSGRAFFVNSALAFATAELLTAALHETCHGLVAQALGFAPKIYAFYEDNPTGSAVQSAAILAAGPLGSLFLGGLFRLWYVRSKGRSGFWRLLLFWLAWLGIMEFVNYLIVTPWLTAGDTAQLADIFGAPLWSRYAVALLGAGFVFLLAPYATADMFAIAPAGTPLEEFRARRRYIVRGFYLPLFAGVVLTGVAGIGGRPEFVFFGLLGTLGNSDIVGASFSVRRPIVTPPPLAQPIAAAQPGIEPAGIALYVALVLFYILVLSRGMAV